jgi:hypothetical protein
MTALPESNTKRYWGVYSVGPDVHKFLMRTGPDYEDSAAIAQITFLWNLWVPSLGADVTLTGLEVAEQGSNVRNTIAIDSPITGEAAGTIAEVQRPREWTIKGRSVDGRRTGLGIFGVFTDTPSIWKQEPISNADWVAARAFLNAQTDTFLSISGQRPTWHNRVTIGYNDHWVKEARG